MIEKLILAGFTPHPPRKEIEKTALGSTKSVPWEYIKQPTVNYPKTEGTRLQDLLFRVD
jgi:hypothetical protein